MRESTPDMAKIGAILIAERIRYDVVRNDSYKFDVDKILGMFRAESTLSGDMDKVAIKDSIMAIQHALVDYVRDEGDILMPIRGAAFLKIMGDELSEDAFKLTTEKITNFRQRRFESLRNEVVRTEPVYGL